MNPTNMKRPQKGRGNYYVLLIGFLFITILPLYSQSQQLAFPDAKGFGKLATGGRGGQVIKVTNLNDSGPGSLRAALLTTGARTVVFEIGGTINLNSAIYITNGNLTLAGQTAPGDGILIRGSLVQVEASNVIISNIRFRPGNSAANTADGLSVTAWDGHVLENIIIDHCSLSWADDENFSIRGVASGIVRNVTIQNSIISECSYGVLTGPRTYNKTFYRNFLAFNQERNIRSNYPTNGTFDFEMINNLIYGYRWATSPSLGSKFTVLNNHYRRSSQIQPFGAAVDGTTSGQGTPSETYAFIQGNITPTGIPEYSANLAPYLQTLPFSSSGIIPINAGDIADELLPHVGASLPRRDSVDERLVNQYNNGNGTFATSGIYPSLTGETPPQDTDNDGMPDFWEIANGLNTSDPSDRNIIQENGYTNLEHYLWNISFSQTSNTSITPNQTICQGEEITLTATGGVSYQWSNGLTSANITVSPDETTTYSVVITLDNGDTQTLETTITVNPIPQANAGEDQNICSGESAILTASGGSSYLWSNGATTQSITVSPNQTTTYSVEVSENGCSSVDEVTVTVNAIPTVNAGDDVTISPGQTVNLTAVGATSYSWSNGETGETITVTPTQTTTYTVIGTSNGCSAEDEVTVFVVGNVAANISGSNAICQGDSTTLSASGGDNFLWNTGETTPSITVNPNQTTTYSVEVSDNFGNSDTAEITITVNPIPQANAGEDQNICSGESAILTASGGSSYLWSNGATTQSITVSPNQTTTYSVEVSENGCSSVDEVTVTVNAIPTVNAGDDVTISPGQTVNLTAVGATSYSWSNGETGETITVTPTQTTTYTVIGTSNGCSAEDEVTVFVVGNVAANISGSNAICQGDSTTLSASGGDNFLWNTGETTPSITVNPNQTTSYSVEVSDNFGNSDTAEITITVNSLPQANAGEDQSICAGESVTLTASGGSNYLWSNGATTQSISVSPNQTTTYSVEVSENGCSSVDDVIVSVTNLPELQVTGNTTVVYGQSTILTVSGAESYSWNTGENSSSITVQPETTTTYEVTGFVNNCFSSTAITVVVESHVQASAGEDQRICQGYEVTLTANGGSSYLWSTGATTQSITVSPSANATYSVTVFDGPFQDTDNVNVIVDPNPNVAIVTGDEATILEGNFITISATGANTYQWSNGATQPNIAVSPSVTTTYEVRGYINDCYDEKAITVNVVPRVVADAGDDITICAEESAVLTATGGDDYLWSTGETTQSIEVAPEETTLYSVTVFNELDFDEASVIVVVDQQCQSVIIGDEETDQTFAFLVHPNPVTETLFIQLNNIMNVSILQMFDMAGKLLFNQKVGQANEAYSVEKEVDVRSFQSGLYFVRLMDDDQVITKKVVVQ